MARVYNELKNFQNVPRSLVFDNEISDRARFVYIFMASKPDDWEFFLEPMSREIGYSVDTLRKYINELVESGWLIKGEQKNEKGTFGAVDYIIKSIKNTDTVIFRHGNNQPQQNNDNIITNTNISVSNKQSKDLKEENSKKEDADFVEQMYKLYPTRCPVRNTTLGKSHKDKERIKRLLKTYSQEDIERVIRHEVDEKYGKSYMSNFSTFLNNFPDPSELFSSKSYGYPHSVDDMKEDDVQTKLDFFNYWIEKKAPNVCDGLSKGRPQTEQQYKSLIEHTEGGARALCYVVLVLNRDGWEQYADERGFMWVYSNYIKANGLYKG